MGKLALFFGANDFGGTIQEENVVTAAGKEHKPARAVEIIKAVESVGRQVAQRNTGYGVLGRGSGFIHLTIDCINIRGVKYCPAPFLLSLAAFSNKPSYASALKCTISKFSHNESPPL